MQMDRSNRLVVLMLELPLRAIILHFTDLLDEVVVVRTRYSQRILKFAKIRPFKIHLHQGLEPGDYQRRMAFLAWLATAHEDGNISSILRTDESSFHNNGTINRHNCHYLLRGSAIDAE
ncbi:hypothetical protein NQ318_022036 [Aromia moschata]|uniref:Uncharacterized protein n=1 Tax=Aromia moschata TaxID=1265417 RepID=A0AAV8Z846_9CUCU|nr:hypothetical protein NQ318_022036 [Aromia moschata]